MEASFKFIKWNDLYKTEKPFQIFANLPDDATDKRFSNLDWEDKPKTVSDLRGRGAEYSLDANGFTVVKHQSHMSDFTDRGRIEREYLPEVEELLREKVGGADKVGGRQCCPLALSFANLPMYQGVHLRLACKSLRCKLHSFYYR
jgi:hypothetical protein